MRAVTDLCGGRGSQGSGAVYVSVTGMFRLKYQRGSTCLTDFIVVMQNVYKLLPKCCSLPSIVISDSRRLTINSNYQFLVFL